MATVREFMTTNPTSLDSGASITDAAKAMRDGDFGSVPVVDEGRLVGVVTDRDIVIRAVAEGAEGTASIARFMSTDTITVEPTDDLEEVRAKLSKHALRRVPVVESGNLVGMLALGDLAEQGKDADVLKDVSAAAPSD